jgi:hypothetical protein
VPIKTRKSSQTRQEKSKKKEDALMDLEKGVVSMGPVQDFDSKVTVLDHLTSRSVQHEQLLTEEV